MISMRDFLSRLQGVQDKGNGQYMARCPCHGDKRQSLAVSMGDDRILVQCLAGCEYSDILSALGLDWKELVAPERLAQLEEDFKTKKSGKPARKKPQAQSKPPVTKPPREKRPADMTKLRVGGDYMHKVTDEAGNAAIVSEKITHAYEYTDREGKPVLRVFRTEKKNFPTIHFDGGSWYWGDGGTSMILYRLPEVLAAIAAGQPVYLVEGEKDVETLRRLGFTATTNKGGAGKWHEDLTALLRGGVVYIVPDVDEPGRKHARMVARALEGHAKEVRIVNLLRQREAELPGKGDVSDLAAALGDDRARTVLAELVERSPVLSRTVTDDDYEDYFVGIHGCMVKNSSVQTYNADGTTKQLANFVALPVEQVEVVDGADKRRFMLTIKGWSATGMHLKKVTIPMDKFESMKWPLEAWGIYASIAEGNGSAQKLRRIIQEAGMRSIVHRVTHCHTGWREIDGKLCFLHGGGAIGAEDVNVQLDFGLNRYRIDGLREGEWLEAIGREAARPLCQNTTLRVMSVAGLRVGVPVIGYLFLTPLRHFLEQRNHRPSFVPFLMGTTGTGKTTYMSLAMNHFGYDFSFEGAQPASFEDSVSAMAQKVFQLKDLPLFVDDYKRVKDPVSQRNRDTLEERIIRMIGDGQIRSTMTSEYTAREDRPVRALCVQTGEELPVLTDSSVPRLYVIELKKGEVPVPNGQASGEYKRRLDEMNELMRLAREGALNETMRGYIEWLAAQGEDFPRRLEERMEALRNEALTRADTDHARMPSAIGYLMLGIRLMLDYMCAEGGMFHDSPEAADQLMESCWAAVLSNTSAQVETMRAEKPTAVFIATLRELLLSKRCIVQEIGKVSLIVPPGMIGYVDENYYYIIPGEALGAVNKSLLAQDISLSMGKTTLLRQLREEKISIPGPNGETLHQIKRGGIHGRYLLLPRYVIDDTPPVQREEQLKMLPVKVDDNPFEGGEDA